MSSKVGRPRLASRQLLQVAAFELFQLGGYRATSVEQIAKTAGFSRATFFNFFTSKAELFWVETDEIVSGLRAHLLECLGRSTVPPLNEALLEHAATLSNSDIPWALQNYRLIEAADDLTASGASRVLGVHRLFVHYLTSHASSASPQASIVLQATAAATAAKMMVALTTWIAAGVNRPTLATVVAQALNTRST